jgi:hypothetical protein
MKVLGFVIVVLVAGGALGVFAWNSGLIGLRGTSNTTTATATSIGGPNPASPHIGDSFAYGCAKPSISSQLSCDQLPPGYVILPREPNAPAAPRLANMTDSAFALIQKTYGNGVCDPNETWLTSPLDCGVPAALVADPYTGRAGSPAVVCQLGNQPQQ